MTQNHHEHSHGPDHNHGHHHENVDYEHMYQQPWVQAMVKQIQGALLANAAWLGIDPSKEQRVLDYACGHGTISLAVLEANPQAICRGIDLDAPQVGRYNKEAEQVLGNEAGARMVGIHGDLYHPTETMDGPEWRDFDLVIMSMALHHVHDPVEMLRCLKRRLQPGGTVVVVELFGGDSAAARSMVEVPTDRQKIWPGFTAGDLAGKMKTAGFEGFDVRVLEEPARVPQEARGEHFGEEQWCFFAKARVSGA